MEDKVSFLIESLQLIADSQGNSERVYAFWRMNIDKIDTLLIQVMPDIASQILGAKGKEEREFIARLFGEFGYLIHHFPLGNRGINSELSIAGYQICVRIVTRNEYPSTWAFYQYDLGVAYSKRIEGDREENIEQAIQAYRAALEVYTRQDFSVEWASTQDNLGTAYKDRIEGDRKGNIEQAIQAYQASMEVYTRQDFPVDWARIGPFKFEVQHHLTDRRIPRGVSDNQAIFLGGHLLDPLLLLPALV